MESRGLVMYEIRKDLREQHLSLEELESRKSQVENTLLPPGEGSTLFHYQSILGNPAMGNMDYTIFIIERADYLAVLEELIREKELELITEKHNVAFKKGAVVFIQKLRSLYPDTLEVKPRIVDVSGDQLIVSFSLMGVNHDDTGDTLVEEAPEVKKEEICSIEVLKSRDPAILAGRVGTFSLSGDSIWKGVNYDDTGDSNE